MTFSDINFHSYCLDGYTQSWLFVSMVLLKRLVNLLHSKGFKRGHLVGCNFGVIVCFFVVIMTSRSRRRKEEEKEKGKKRKKMITTREDVYFKDNERKKLR